MGRLGSLERKAGPSFPQEGLINPQEVKTVIDLLNQSQLPTHAVTLIQLMEELRNKVEPQMAPGVNGTTLSHPNDVPIILYRNGNNTTLLILTEESVDPACIWAARPNNEVLEVEIENLPWFMAKFNQQQPANPSVLWGIWMRVVQSGDNGHSQIHLVTRPNQHFSAGESHLVQSPPNAALNLPQVSIYLTPEAENQLGIPRLPWLALHLDSPLHWELFKAQEKPPERVVETLLPSMNQAFDVAIATVNQLSRT